MPAEFGPSRTNGDVLAGPRRPVRRPDAPGRGRPRPGGAGDRRLRTGVDDRPSRTRRAARRPSCAAEGRHRRAAHRRFVVPRQGPIYVVDALDRVAIDWMFNGWGDEVQHRGIRTISLRRGGPTTPGTRAGGSPMVLEGGSITVDGEGTLITTIQCLMHPNRNPDLHQARHRGTTGRLARRDDCDLAAVRTRRRR